MEDSLNVGRVLKKSVKWMVTKLNWEKRAQTKLVPQKASHFALGKYLTFKPDNNKHSEGHYKVSFGLTLALHALDALKHVWSNQEVFPQCQNCFTFCKQWM